MATDWKSLGYDERFDALFAAIDANTANDAGLRQDVQQELQALKGANTALRDANTAYDVAMTSLQAKCVELDAKLSAATEKSTQALELASAVESAEAVASIVVDADATRIPLADGRTLAIAPHGASFRLGIEAATAAPTAAVEPEPAAAPVAAPAPAPVEQPVPDTTA